MANLYSNQYIVTPNGTITFNNNVVGEYRLMKVAGRDDQDMRNPIDKVPQTDGEYPHKFFRDARYPVLQGIIGPDADVVTRDLQIFNLLSFMDSISDVDGQYFWQPADLTLEERFMWVRKWDQILIEEGSTSSVTLQVSSKSNSSLVPYWKTFTIPLIAYDPTVYGATSHNTSDLSDGGTVTITNAGDRPVYPTITLTGPITGFTLKNTSIIDPNTGATARVVAGDQATIPGNVKAFSLGSGDTASLIMGPIQQTLYFTPSITNSLGSIDFTQSDFWPLNPGANVIDVSISGGGYAVISYRNAYSN